MKVAWAAVPDSTVVNSFLSCAITTQLDGSDDNQIHCFKPGEPCEGGRDVLAEKMQHFMADPDEIDDPFSSDEDQQETENNEICIDYDDDEGIDGNSSVENDN